MLAMQPPHKQMNKRRGNLIENKIKSHDTARKQMHFVLNGMLHVNGMDACQRLPACFFAKCQHSPLFAIYDAKEVHEKWLLLAAHYYIPYLFPLSTLPIVFVALARAVTCNGSICFYGTRSRQFAINSSVAFNKSYDLATSVSARYSCRW